jgi:RNA-binding protein YhbY
MDDAQFFTYIDSEKLCELIHNAKKSVIYAAPGVMNDVASALLQASVDLGEGMVTVCLDVSEQSIRMGFGEFGAVETLSVSVVINNIPNLRFALIIVDGQGYSFSPTALYLESEQSTSLGFNAIKLTEQQVIEATTRLSPAAKAIALASCKTQEQREKIASTIPEIPNNPLDEQVIKRIDSSIKNNPLVKFDVTRQVRVYSSYLQYVELSMTGAAIQRRKISMPKSLQSVGTANTELEGRFNTSFDLLAKDNALSSKMLEKELRDIRDKFTSSLGKDRGRVLLVRKKVRFLEKIAELDTKLTAHAQKVREKLQQNIDESKNAIVDIYERILKDNEPEDMLDELGAELSDSNKRKWILVQLDSVFPCAEELIGKMELRYDFKDLTYETLNKKEFIDNVKKAFIYEDWDKAYQESIAASGIN